MLDEENQIWLKGVEEVEGVEWVERVERVEWVEGVERVEGVEGNFSIGSQISD